MAVSILDSEIHEQPVVLKQLLASELDNSRKIAAALRGQFEYVLIAARGTSDNAARYAQYLFGAHNRLQVALATPSLFTLYRCPPDLTGTLVVGISQSGQSPDIVSVLAEGRRQGRPTLAITNDPESPLAENADFILPLHAAPERAIAATKSYTASLAALALLSTALEDNPDHLRELQQMPEMIEGAFAGVEPNLRLVQRYRYMSHCVVVGRGYNYSTAFEVALKVKELTRVVAEPYSSADFRHGPIATVQPGFPVLLIAPKGAISEDMAELIQRMKKLGAEMVVISDEQDLLVGADLPLPIPEGVPEWLTPLVMVVPGQLFARHLAVAKKLNPDQPEGLTKVTETL
ncbi:MAG TPA: SIS domain-containing protein [Anaerolineaceae bacterium]|nr:SIS domain-containing protein [Anaerolineaceae bacterium]